MIYAGDLQALMTHDGMYTEFPSGAQAFLSYKGFGAPPTDFQLRRGYKQDGSTEEGYRLEPRLITINLWSQSACSRQEYWDRRAQLLEIFRHNRGGPLTLIVTQPNGARRALLVRANPGPQFDSDPDKNNWMINETIELVALDPVWFDPTPTEYVIDHGSTDHLVFPITFPIEFGPEGGLYRLPPITYLGSWDATILIRIDGPYTTARVENRTIGKAISLAVPVVTGDWRVVDLRASELSIRDSFGVDCFGEQGPDSDLVDFTLKPHPLVTGGVQEIVATLQGSTEDSRFRFVYYTRYFAL